MPDQAPNQNQIFPLNNVAAAQSSDIVKHQQPGLKIELVQSRACLHLSAHKGKTSPLSKLLEKHYGISAPKSGLSQRVKNITISWAGYEQWFLIADDQDETAFYNQALENLGKFSSIADQSHGRIFIAVEGEKASALLAKGTPVDLHHSVFAVGSCATTEIAKVATHITKTDHNRFEICLYRSYAESFWHWLVLMSQEYGAD